MQIVFCVCAAADGSLRYVLPYCLERKTWGDLYSAMNSKRHTNQRQRMLRCGLLTLIYVLEGDVKSLPGYAVNSQSSLMDEARALVRDGFYVERTASHGATLQYLVALYHLIKAKHK
jgi:ERCC4-type nuclease